MKTNINSDERQNITFHGWLFTGVIHYFVEEAINDNFHLLFGAKLQAYTIKVGQKQNKKCFFFLTQ